MTDKEKNPKSPKVPADAARQFLELYYPIHYKAGIGVEDALRGSELSRHQTAILWLIHSQGDNGLQMRRKDIVNALSNWFEISNAAISKALRGMSDSPLGLVRQDEDPSSGREKVVTLTKKGERHLEQMIERGNAYVQRIVDGLSDAQIVNGIDFFQRITAVVDGWAEAGEGSGAGVGKDAGKGAAGGKSE